MYVLVASLLLSAALRGSGLVARALLRADLFASTTLNFYKGQKSNLKRTFKAAQRPKRILALHMKIDLFTTAQRSRRILASNRTFKDPKNALSLIIFWTGTCKFTKK